MALRRKGKYRYSDSQLDIRDELLRYSELNGHSTTYYADASCICGNNRFNLSLDDNEGAAVRRCVSCKVEYSIADSNEFLANAELVDCQCPCGSEVFEITIGVSLYQNSNDVNWLYIGCRCVICQITACYGDWKNEFIDFRELLNCV